MRSIKGLIANGILPALILAPASSMACTIGTNSVTAANGLSFGAIFSGTSGTVTMSPAGSRTASGVFLATMSQFPQGTAAAFDVCAATGTTATITLPANGTVTLTGPGSATMAVNDFTSSPADPISVNSDSSVRLYVGATLTVAATQAAGNYSGSFQITATYQ